MRPESSRIISAEPNELLAVKDHCHVGTFPRTNGTERLTGVVSSESAGARIVRCLGATLCARPAPRSAQPHNQLQTLNAKIHMVHFAMMNGKGIEPFLNLIFKVQ